MTTSGIRLAPDKAKKLTAVVCAEPAAGEAEPPEAGEIKKKKPRRRRWKKKPGSVPSQGSAS
jgi:hypothetical protein